MPADPSSQQDPAVTPAPPGGRPPFRVGHAGSLLRPAGLLAARADFAAGRISAGERGELESKNELKRRIAAARAPASAKLCLSPQCGFSSTREGNELTAGRQWAKPRLVVETAQEVWGA